MKNRYIGYQIRADSMELVGDRLRVDGYLSRTGVQEYLVTDGAVRREYRDPAEVFAEDSLKSFRGMTVTVGHSGRVTPKNWSGRAVGHVGDDPRRSDDGEHVAASIWLQDAAVIERVLSRELQELSLGYSTHVDPSPGVSPDGVRYDARQKMIRGNHVALLKSGEARGGSSVRLRLDSQLNEIIEEKQEKLMEFKIRANGIDFTVEAPDDNVCRALEQEHADFSERITTAQKALAEAEARADSAGSKTEELEKIVQDHKDQEALKIRQVIREDALKVAPKLSISDSDTPEQIRQHALSEIGIPVDGKSSEYVEARFDIALESVKDREKPIDSARGSNAITPPTEANTFSLDTALRVL